MQVALLQHDSRPPVDLHGVEAREKPEVLEQPA
jgi:hypothetical protein